MKLIQIPFSHNCIKVRRALEIKKLSFEIADIHPLERETVIAETGQWRVPALIDGEERIVESTEILRYLEERHPQPSLLPENDTARAECWLIEDWADVGFAERTRRIAYWQVLATPGRLEQAFFPQARGIKRAVMSWRARQVLTKRLGLSEKRNRSDEKETLRLAKVAMQRLGAGPYFFGERMSVADITLAAMLGPLLIATPALREAEPVASLLAWSEPILGDEVVQRYRSPSPMTRSVA